LDLSPFTTAGALVWSAAILVVWFVLVSVVLVLLRLTSCVEIARNDQELDDETGPDHRLDRGPV